MAIPTELTPYEAADRLAIRELFDAYAHCADRRDAEGQKAQEAEIRLSIAGMFAISPEIRIAAGRAALRLPEVPDTSRKPARRGHARHPASRRAAGSCRYRPRLR
jgi:hypothetical protein